MSIAMFIFGALTILSALGVVFTKKTLYSALWLVMTFFLVGIHYALLGAHFLANLQILVYAGAIMVLVIFVILLLGLHEIPEAKRVQFPSYVSCAMVGAFIGLLVVAVSPKASGRSYLAPEAAQQTLNGSAQELGASLFDTFFFPFEVISVLLLAGVIGAVVLAYEPRRPLMAGRGLKAKQREYGHETESGVVVPAVKEA